MHCIDGVKSKKKLYFKFDHTAWRKMMLYTRYAKGEISGLGLVDMIDGALYVSDVFIVRQEATAASVELDPDHLAEIMTEAVQRGDKTFSSRLRLWWHSHCDMNTYHSSTDTDTVDLLGKYSPYVLSVVTNKKEEYDAALNLFDPVRVTIKEVEVLQIDNDELDEKCREEVHTMVKEPVFSRPPLLVYYEKGKRLEKELDLSEEGLDSIWPDRDTSEEQEAEQGAEHGHVHAVARPRGV